MFPVVIIKSQSRFMKEEIKLLMKMGLFAKEIPPFITLLWPKVKKPINSGWAIKPRIKILFSTKISSFIGISKLCIEEIKKILHWFFKFLKNHSLKLIMIRTKSLITNKNKLISGGWSIS